MAQNNKKKYTLKVSGSTENLEVIREFIHRLASKAGFNEDDASQIELAVDEACTNSIKHAYRYNQQHFLEITVYLDPVKIEVVVSDKGPGFDVSAIPEPDLKAFAMQAKSGGLGIHLMRTLMDEVHFSFHPGKKNQVSLIKYLEKSV